MAMQIKSFAHTFARCERLLIVFAAYFIVGLNALSAQDDSNGLPTDESLSLGYFPTIAEDTLLRGSADSRSGGLGLVPDSVDGPDGRAQAASGLFRYYDSNPDFYERNTNAFRPLNQTLGLFTPHDSLTLESARLRAANLTVDANFNLFTRTLVPELAHVKAGPLYFDLLWIGAGALYSDFTSSPGQNWSEDDEDGFAAYIDIAFRGMLRITDSIYVSAVANLIYLPLENEVALRFGNQGNPSILVDLQVNQQFGEWEITFYDVFRGFSGLEYLVNADSPAIDRAGRYSFGFANDRRSNNFYTREAAFFANNVAVFATRPVFGNQWRYGLGAGHGDFWRTFSFEDHNTRDWLNTWLQYEGSIIPFAPRFSYEYTSGDGFDSLLHMLQIQLTGRLAENVSWGSMIGYAFLTGNTNENERFIWNVNLDHVITRTLSHQLSFGQGYFYNEFTSDTRSSDYIRYSIHKQISSRLDTSIFAQYTYNESSVDQLFPDRDRFGGGFQLTYRPLDFTSIDAIAYYDQADQQNVSEDSSRWLYRLSLSQQLGFRLTGSLFYQYEDLDNGLNSFTESLVGVSMRRYF